MPVSALTNVSDWDTLLTEIRNFLNATGDWTIHVDNASPPSGEGTTAGGRELVVSNGVCLAGLRSTTSGPGANRMLLFDGVPPWSVSHIDAMPNNSGISLVDGDYTNAADPINGRRTNPAFAGPFPTAFLFTDDPSTYLHVVVEVIAGRYRHFHFGNMRKFGTWTGGAYYAMTFWSQIVNVSIDIPSSSFHHTPFDAANAQTGLETTFYYDDGTGCLWRAVTETTFNGVVRKRGHGTQRGSGMGRMFRSIQETPFSGLIALQPITFWSTTTADTPDTIRCMGQIKDVAAVNMRNLQPGQSYFIGSDEWMTFPLAQKGDPAVGLDVENSGYFGMAYLVKP